MTEVSPVSQTHLRERRTSLRQRRRLKIIQSLWRIWAMAALTGGVFWAAGHPIWLIRDGSQIEVQGNQVLSDQAIRALVSLDYPQPLLKIEPDAIAQQLQQRAPITTAHVVRQLFPPQVSIHVQERQPVAQALPAPGTFSKGVETPYVQPGLLDASGAWIPQSSFTLLDEAPELPQLQVYGMRPRDRQHWPDIYQAIRQSPVAIQRIDWSDASNLILYTELGPVHMGPYSYQFANQLSVLDRLRSLPGQVDTTAVAYIDLRNPGTPSVEVFQAYQGESSANTAQ